MDNSGRWVIPGASHGAFDSLWVPVLYWAGCVQNTIRAGRLGHDNGIRGQPASWRTGRPSCADAVSGSERDCKKNSTLMDAVFLFGGAKRDRTADLNTASVKNSLPRTPHKHWVFTPNLTLKLLLQHYMTLTPFAMLCHTLP